VRDDTAGMMTPAGDMPEKGSMPYAAGSKGSRTAGMRAARVVSMSERKNGVGESTFV